VAAEPSKPEKAEPAAPPYAKPDAALQEENDMLEMENKIFSKTLDALKSEVQRLKIENEKISSDLKDKDKLLADAVAESNRLALQLRNISNSMTSASGPSATGGYSAAAGGAYSAPPASAEERADSLLAGHLFSYKLSSKDVGKLREIHKRTNFEQVTVDKLFEVFAQHADDGVVNRKQFGAAVDQLGVVPANQRFLFDRLYALFDRNNDQKVDFGEFAGGLSVLCSGSSDDKIKLMFTFVDSDQNGDLSKDELTQFFMTLLVVTKGLKDGTMLDEMQISALESQCKAEVEECFRQVDKDGDGKLSYDEFLGGMNGRQSQLQGLLQIFSALEIDGDNDIAADDLDVDANPKECNQQ